MSLLSVSMENAELRNRAEFGIVDAQEYSHRHWKRWLLIIVLIAVAAIFLKNSKPFAVSDKSNDSILTELHTVSEATVNDASAINYHGVSDIPDEKSELVELKGFDQSNLGELEYSDNPIVSSSDKFSISEQAGPSATESSYPLESYTSIDEALHSASQFIQMQRLTRPSSGNAYDAIVWVLDKAPNNLNAQQLLLDLQARYQSLITESRNEVQAQQYSQRLKRIELAHPNILQLSETLGFKNSAATNIKSKIDAEEMRISIESASELSVAQVISELANLNSNKQHAKAIELLKNQIATAHPNSSVLKAALIDQEFLGRNLAALEVLGHDLHAESANYARARSLQLQFGASKTKDYLASLPIEQLSPASLLLLAGLQRENSEFELAFASYQKLLRLDQNNGQAWLGYAVTAESLGKLQLALYAYRKVLIASSIGASFGVEVDAFVKSRVIELAAKVSVDAEGENSW